MEVRENIERSMAAGEARRAALRTFGNALVVREKLAAARPLYFCIAMPGTERDC